MGMLISPQMLSWMKQYGIGNAALLNGGYISRTYSTAGDRNKWEIRTMICPADFQSYGHLYSAGSSSYDLVYFDTASANELLIQINGVLRLRTSQAFRDYTGWMDILIQYDAAQAVAADRLKLFINREQVTDFVTDARSGITTGTAITNTAVPHRFGCNQIATQPLHTYLAEACITSGVLNGVDGYSEVGAATGNSIAKQPTGPFGAEGAYLDFSNADVLGLNKAASGSFGTNRCRDGSGGTDIGNATNLSQCFDGNKYETYVGNCPYAAGSGLIYLYAGKSWGAARTIAGFRLFPITDYYGYSTANSGTMTLKLQGSTDNFSSSIVDLYTDSAVALSTTNVVTVESGITTTTAYPYHRIVLYENTPDPASHVVCLSEVEFFEAGDYAMGGHWEVYGTVAQVASTPTNAIATMNPLAVAGHGSTYADGNLTICNGGGYDSLATLALEEKAYWEVTINSASGSVPAIGVGEPSSYLPHTNNWYSASHAAGVKKIGQVVVDGVGGATYTPYDATDVVGIAFDPDTGKFWYRVNGGAWVNSGDPVAGTGAACTATPGRKYWPVVYCGSSSATVNFGATDFADTPPAGFGKLSTNNLPTMTSTGKNLDKHFRTVLHTSLGSGTINVNPGFDPTIEGWAHWIKCRDNSPTSHVLMNSINPSKRLHTDDTAAESDYSSWHSATSSGFDLVYGNSTSNWLTTSFVNWIFRLPISQGNSDGSIAVTSGKQKINADLGTSWTEFTGTGTNATIGHGLPRAPGVVLMKNLDSAGEWVVYHSSLGATKNLELNSSASAYTYSNRWNDTEPTETVVSVGDYASLNANGDRILMVCFCESDFIRIGSFVGNASLDGPMICENLSPVFSLIKNADNTNNSWPMQDAVRNMSNPISKRLHANLVEAEYSTGSDTDFVATGQKIRSTNTENNGPSHEHVYLLIGQPTGAKNANEANGR